MTLLTKWYHLFALMRPQSIIKLGFVWAKNVFGLSKTLLRDWWPLILALTSIYAGLMERLLRELYTPQDRGNGVILNWLWNGVARTLQIGFVIKMLTGLLVGMWLGALLLAVHPSMLPKGREFYRRHIVIFLLITITVTVCYLNLPITVAGLTLRTWPTPWIIELKELFLIFVCFFIFDARPAVSEYLRATTVLPVRLIIFNLPLMIPLYFILVAIHLAPAVVAIGLLAPLFITVCSILYRLSVNNHYEDYYGVK